MPSRHREERSDVAIQSLPPDGARARTAALARLRHLPAHRLVKARKVRHTHRRLRSRLAAYHAGTISFAELDASIQGWINHVGSADTWGLRRHILETLPVVPAEHRRAIAAQQKGDTLK